VEEVVRGVALACRENGCVLLGGETAQMPEFYGEGEYDLAGFIVGLVARDRILDGSRVRPGDALIALPSSGLHTNGYTLARKIVLERAGLALDAPFPGLDETVGEALLRIHRSYLPVLRDELERESVRALAHITGGGIPGNLPRSLPSGLGAVIRSDSWEIPPLFRALERLGGVDRAEMYRVFNMGVGVVAAVAAEDADPVVARLQGAGEPAWIAGEVVAEKGVRFA
jgi:phosphoribosylformylglycinamidine cyclo-ligase